VEARRAHNPKVVGSNPTPATSRFKEQNSDHRVRSALSICGVSESDLRILLKGFILNAKVEGLSSRTIDYYQDKLGNFQWYVENQGLPTNPTGVTTDHIRHFLAYLRDNKRRWESDNPRANKPLSPRSIQHYYGCLRSFFNWLVSEGYIESNPVLAIKPPKAPRTLVKALSNEDIEAMLGRLNGRDFNDVRNRAALMLFIDTGLRLSELANISVDDIDLERQTILVMGKGSKQRMVRFGVKTAEALWRYLAIRAGVNGTVSGLWLDHNGNPVGSNAFQCFIKRLSQQTGITIYPHKLRHTYAISALRNGMSPFVLQISLGHSTLDMTRRYCSSLGFDDVYKAHVAASPIDHIKIR